MKTIRPSVGRRLGKENRRQLRVLYQDDAVVVLNKPAKMLAVPADDSDPRQIRPRMQVGPLSSVAYVQLALGSGSLVVWVWQFS